MRGWLRAADLFFLQALQVSAPLKGDPSTTIELLLAARKELALVQHLRAVGNNMAPNATALHLARLSQQRQICQAITSHSVRTIISEMSSQGAAVVNSAPHLAKRALYAGGEMVVIVANPIGWELNLTIAAELPKKFDEQQLSTLAVTDPEGNAILSQISMRRQLLFHASVPALGIRAFFVKTRGAAALTLAVRSQRTEHIPSGPASQHLTITLQGGQLRAIFSDITGELLALEETSSGRKIEVGHQVLQITKHGESEEVHNVLQDEASHRIWIEHGNTISELQREVHDLRAPGWNPGSQVSVLYRVFTAADSDVMGTTIEMELSMDAVPPSTTIVSRLSAKMPGAEGPPLLFCDDGDFANTPLDEAPGGAFRPMASRAFFKQHHGSHMLALVSPVSVGIRRVAPDSLEVAHFNRSPGYEHQAAHFKSRLWLSMLPSSSEAAPQLAKMLRYPPIRLFSPAPSRQAWQKSFRGIHQPLRPNSGSIEYGLLQQRVHVMSAHIRDDALDSAVLRFVNLHDHSDARIALREFCQKMRLVSWKVEPLALSFRNSSVSNLNNDDMDETLVENQNYAIIHSRSALTFSAQLQSAQPFDHPLHDDEDQDGLKNQNHPRDIEGRIRGDSSSEMSAESTRQFGPDTANSNAEDWAHSLPSEDDRKWLHSMSLSSKPDSEDLQTVRSDL